MVERTVQFWQLVDPFGNPLGGDFPARAVSQAIADLSVKERYADLREGMRVLGESVKTTSPAHVVLHRVRRDNLPAVEEDGQLTDVKITKRQNLAEATHVCFFGRNVIGVLYNHDGPRIGRLCEFLSDRLGVAVTVKPVLDPDTATRLATMGIFTSVDIAIPTDQANFIEDDPDDPSGLPAALRTLASTSQGKTVYARVVIQGVGSAHAASMWRNFFERVVGGSQLSLFKKFQAHGRRTPEAPPQTIDFVQEQLVMKEDVEMEATSSRRVRPTSAASAIADAHKRLETQINNAVTPVANKRITIRDLRST